MKNQNKNRKKRDNNPLQESGETTLSGRKLPSPTPEQIRKRAQEIYVARGDAPGNDLLDWLQAERELKAEMAQLPEEDPAGPENPFSPRG